MTALSCLEQESELLTRVAPAPSIPQALSIVRTVKWLIHIFFVVAQQPRLPNHKYLLDECCLGYNYLTQAMS